MTMTDPHWLATRQSLLTRLKDWGDARSWREFFDAYSGFIYSVARRSGLNDAEAQDVVQETLVTVAKQMPGFRYDARKGSFKGWLRRTTQWRIQDQFRKRQRQRLLEERVLAEPASGPNVATTDWDRLWEQEWQQCIMQEAMERIQASASPRELQVFDLCSVKGWPAARVAKQLGLLRSQVYYINKKVARLLKRHIQALDS